MPLNQIKLQANPSLFHTGMWLRKSVNLKFDLSYDLFAIFSHYTNTNITGIFLQPWNDSELIPDDKMDHVPGGEKLQ